MLYGQPWRIAMNVSTALWFGWDSSKDVVNPATGMGKAKKGICEGKREERVSEDMRAFSFFSKAHPTRFSLLKPQSTKNKPNLMRCSTGKGGY